jgi:hypothetical protein
MALGQPLDDRFPSRDDLSSGRTLGLGIQFLTAPFGLLSGRLWWNDFLGGEIVGIVFGSSSQITLRALVKVVNSRAADLYFAGGASFSGSTTIVHAVAGMEWSVSEYTAFNFEMGFANSSWGPATVIGGGLHFYFQ